MIFAKGVTSGYIPLSGVMISHELYETLRTQKGTLAHGFTYSGHPTACAVALENLRLIEEERLSAAPNRNPPTAADAASAEDKPAEPRPAIVPADAAE